MKKTLFLLLALLVWLPFQAGAKPPTEKDLQEKVKELGYMGQMDRATELVGEKTDFASGKQQEGWDMTSLMLSMIWGTIGTGYFIYGKKQSRFVFLMCGVGLCVIPMFVTGTALSSVICIVLFALPFKVDF